MKTSSSPLCSPSPPCPALLSPRSRRSPAAKLAAAAALTPAAAANLRNETARPQVLDLRARVSYRDELLADSSRCADAGASLAHRSIARVA